MCEVRCSALALVCSGCGLAAQGGQAGCQALFDAVLARSFADPAYATVHRLVVDTYCLQHPDTYCVSAKSLAAHLTGLCWALDYAASPGVGRALTRWLDGPFADQKPALPATVGALTIAEVHGATDATDHLEAAERWARATWAAYGTLHPLAHRWIEAALTRP